MKMLLIASTIYEKLRRVKVHSHGSQWKLTEGIVMLIRTHRPECANYENGLYYYIEKVGLTSTHQTASHRWIFLYYLLLLRYKIAPTQSWLYPKLTQMVLYQMKEVRLEPTTGGILLTFVTPSVYNSFYINPYQLVLKHYLCSANKLTTCRVPK